MNVFELIKSRVMIYNVISNYVKLTKKGANYQGCCPFHAEKTPSFYVNTGKNFFYCFGCHAGGDVIVFMERFFKISKKEVIEKLAQQFNIELPKGVQVYSNEYQNSLAVLTDVAQYYHRSLNLSSIEYLESRQIDSELRKVFVIGYACSLDNLVNNSKISRNDLIKAELLKSSNYSNGYYEFFRNRIMFPICNNKGLVVGFGARAVDQHNKVAKYINSVESDFFKKREVFFGEYQAWSHIEQTKKVYIVEGYLDCMRMYQYGYVNTLATCGTAFGLTQAQRLVLIIKEVYFCFDGDAAGKRAMMKCLDIICNIVCPGVDFKFIILPDGYDPDSYMLKYGKEGFMRLTCYTYIDVIFNFINDNFSKLDEMHEQLIQFRDKIKHDSVRYYFDMKVKSFLWQRHNEKHKNRLINRKTVQNTVDKSLNSGFVKSQFQIINNDSSIEGKDVLSTSIISLFVFGFDSLVRGEFFAIEEFNLLKLVHFDNKALNDIRLLIVDNYESLHNLHDIVRDQYISVYDELKKFYSNIILDDNVDKIMYNLRIYIIRYAIMFYKDEYIRKDEVSNSIIVLIRQLQKQLKALEEKIF